MRPSMPKAYPLYPELVLLFNQDQMGRGWQLIPPPFLFEPAKQRVTKPLALVTPSGHLRLSPIPIWL